MLYLHYQAQGALDRLATDSLHIKKRTIKMNAKQYTFKKDSIRAKIELELEEGCFSCSGLIYEGGKCTQAGQCIDTIAELFPDNETVKEIHELWKKYHLNDMHAGTKAQEGALERAGLSEFANKYSECCEYLKSIGLYDDGGYKFGTGWLKWEIPAKDLKRIEKLLDVEGKNDR